MLYFQQLAVCVFLVFISISSSNASDKKDEAETVVNDISQSFEQQRQHCTKYLVGSVKKFVLMIIGKNRTDKETSASQAKCFMSCLMAKAKMMNPRNGEIHPDRVVQKMSQMTDHGEQQMADDASECKAQAMAAQTACERGYTMVTCMFKKLKESKKAVPDAPKSNGAPATDAPEESGAPATDAPEESGAPATDAPEESGSPATAAYINDLDI